MIHPKSRTLCSPEPDLNRSKAIVGQLPPSRSVVMEGKQGVIGGGISNASGPTMNVASAMVVKLMTLELLNIDLTIKRLTVYLRQHFLRT